MKLLLLSDVSGLGKAGDVIEAKPGYARNFLIPQNKARIVSEEEVAKVEEAKLAESKKHSQEHEERQGLAAQLGSIKLVFEVKAAKSGKVFGSIDKAKIVEELARKANYTAKESDIILEKPLKELGEYQVGVKLGDGITAEISVILSEIVSEE